MIDEKEGEVLRRKGRAPKFRLRNRLETIFEQSRSGIGIGIGIDREQATDPAARKPDEL